MTVAALYVETGGVYYGLPDVDPWDEARDARLYAGPWPVVAHPPCARWCRMAGQMEYLHGLRIGDDGGKFAAALASVRQFGGVLEHPAHSIAWDRFDLPEPVAEGYWMRSLTDPGYVCEVSQAAYGHPMAKETWLYYIGDDPPELDWSRPPATGQISYPSAARREERDQAVLLPEIPKRERSRTPLAFRDVLLDMARSAGGEPDGAGKVCWEARLDGCT